MATQSVQLNETAKATSDSLGNAKIVFNQPGVNRVWQGTVSVNNSTPGTEWQVLLGGIPAGTLYAPGPFGPIQMLSGQQLSLVGVDTPATIFTAILLGVNDSVENPTPYTGPTSVTSITLGGP